MLDVKLDILRVKDADGNWVSIPAVSSSVVQDGNTITIGDKKLTLNDDGSVTWSNITI